jgi:hypothetical protein
VCDRSISNCCIKPRSFYRFKKISAALSAPHPD